jgi:hypothetical protein
MRRHGGDEVVGTARVEQRHQGHRTEGDGDMHRVCRRDPGHRLQGETGRVRVCIGRARLFRVRSVIDLHAVDEENAPAKTVVATGVLLITAKAEALAAPVRHLLRGQPPAGALTAALRRSRRRRRQRQRGLGRRERLRRQSGRRMRQDAACRWFGQARHRDLGELHQLYLSRQAHSGVEGTGVEDLHRVTERRQQTPV